MDLFGVAWEKDDWWSVVIMLMKLLVSIKDCLINSAFQHLLSL
jgi:hypothetical protein